MLLSSGPQWTFLWVTPVGSLLDSSISTLEMGKNSRNSNGKLRHGSSLAGVMHMHHRSLCPEKLPNLSRFSDSYDLLSYT